ncbi:putative LPS assembly protein LptD [Flavobacterium selenitireducens]|uniref:putative LPS assembly protein LptD n=1 Tax=Flavobacterium selenitireducens TaxID=2722704 RepID=UPI00168BDFAF|nr:putative LPS assembly protein LptD [Flavobacterium selenitireducens]MBD3580955.1 LPS-assembly protein LptD [Flavobacterium selenitireducens]
MRANLFHIVLSAILLTVGASKCYSQELKNQTTKIPPLLQAPPAKPVDSSIVNATDTTKIAVPIVQDSVKPKKPLLESQIRRKAKDYERFNQKTSQLTLFNEAEVYYQDIELKSGIIVLDYGKDEIYAGRIKDSTGALTQRPIFKQGQNVVEPDSIRFNTKTKKALIWNSRTEQSEFRIKADIVKRENDSVYYMKSARFTTSKDVDNPEYYFFTQKAKFVPGKKVVVGGTNMVIADVPTPIYLPFAFFPMTDKAQSGILIPSYGESNNRGFFLQNIGYYFALSDNYDLAVTGDYYTNGSYAMRFESRYASRYNFSGNLNVRFENLINGERGYPDYAKQRIYNIQWSHSQDPKANVNSRFSASVNLGSSQYFRQSVNQVNVGSSLNNTLSSSISYSKTFQTVPQVNLSVTASHQQNTETKAISMTLPTLQLNVDRIFPFAPADGSKKGFIKNLNVQYSLKGENRYQTFDSLFFKPEMFKDARTGFQHTIPVSTNFKIFKYFSASTSFNYNEVWYFKTIERRYDEQRARDTTINVNGFDSFRTYNFGTSLGTTIYGTYQFGEKSRIQAIRHVMRPSVSYSYTPSFDQYYDTYETRVTAETIIKEYTRFENGIFGSPGKNISNSVGFSLSNTFEAKMTDRDTTKTEPKKLMLLNNLNFSTSYNIAADSLKWSPLRITGGTTLFEKMNVNFGATLNPYAIDNTGRTINKFNIDNGGSLFRFTNANLTVGYSLASTDGNDAANKKSPDSQGVRNGGREDDLFGSNLDPSDPRQDDDEDDEAADIKDFFKLDIPWDMTLAYSLTYSNNRREKEIAGNSLMVSANTDITPMWKVGVSTGYDFVQQGFTFTQLRFSRDLLSWKMDFSWVPFGQNTYWNFFIGIKSSILQDIKYDKRSLPNR